MFDSVTISDLYRWSEMYGIGFVLEDGHVGYIDTEEVTIKL